MSDVMDRDVILDYLHNATMHGAAQNDWAEGFWIGRAVQHAHQNAVNHDWLRAQFRRHGIDEKAVAVLDPGPAARAVCCEGKG